MKQLVPPNERIIILIRPHPLFVILATLGPLVATFTLAVLIYWLASWAAAPGLAMWAIMVGSGIVLAIIVWNALERSVRVYALTERRILWVSGFLRRVVVESPIERIQNIAMVKRVRERLFGLGTLAFATAGTDTFEIVWSTIDRPDERFRQARAELDRVRAAAISPPPPVSPPRRPLVVGLAGGIGAGKSEVARILRSLGCLVLDSDTDAKSILDEPEVREELVRWWGEEVLYPPEPAEPGESEPTRRIDRSAIARIVFGDPQQRARLERLIHPILKQRRRRIIDEASTPSPSQPTTPRAIVIDAPLLFEAGVDAECDTTVFVDAPRDQRLTRLAAARGWSEEELDRREAAQLPLDEKRRRSAHVVTNGGDRVALERQVVALLDRIAPRQPA